MHEDRELGLDRIILLITIITPLMAIVQGISIDTELNRFYFSIGLLMIFTSLFGTIVFYLAYILRYEERAKRYIIIKMQEVENIEKIIRTRIRDTTLSMACVTLALLIAETIALLLQVLSNLSVYYMLIIMITLTAYLLATFHIIGAFKLESISMLLKNKIHAFSVFLLILSTWIMYIQLNQPILIVLLMFFAAFTLPMFTSILWPQQEKGTWLMRWTLKITAIIPLMFIPVLLSYYIASPLAPHISRAISDIVNAFDSVIKIIIYISVHVCYVLLAFLSVYSLATRSTWAFKTRIANIIDLYSIVISMKDLRTTLAALFIMFISVIAILIYYALNLNWTMSFGLLCFIIGVLIFLSSDIEK